MVDLPFVRCNVPYVENTHMLDFCLIVAKSAISSNSMEFKPHMVDLFQSVRFKIFQI